LQREQRVSRLALCARYSIPKCDTTCGGRPPAVRIAFALRPRPRVGAGALGEDACLRELSLGVVILNEEKGRA
jgi:hypothetical protein